MKPKSNRSTGNSRRTSKTYKGENRINDSTTSPYGKSNTSKGNKWNYTDSRNELRDKYEKNNKFRTRANRNSYTKNSLDDKLNKNDYSYSKQTNKNNNLNYSDNRQDYRDSTVRSYSNLNYSGQGNPPKLNPEIHNNFSHSTDVPVDIVWGRHSTLAVLESGRPIHRIWCTTDLRNSQKFLRLLREAKSSGVLIEEVTWARLGQITHGSVHQGIVIQVAAAETLELSTLIEACSKLTEPSLLLALDGITDPQNLGAIIRSAEAFGAHGLILPQRRSAGLTGSVAKVAAGALEHLPVARVVNLNRALDDLKNCNYKIIGLAEEGNETISNVKMEGPIVLLVGSESKGISLVTRRYCDQLIRIPLRGETPSLNASVATAICLFEVARRGWMKGLSGQDPTPRLNRANLSTLPTSSFEI
tara:strand:+ start:5729 stop:6976 length:1248 start_codon:yes stop_codon:yes gene_type:complete